MTPPDLPYFHSWERAAAKELADINHLLAHGLFEDYNDLCDRLLTAADNIRQTQAIVFDTPPIEPQLPQLPSRGNLVALPTLSNGGILRKHLLNSPDESP
jgi:hypothetical protein